MNNFPQISVIIPTYNRAHLLPRAVESVLRQTFQDFELIIIDDGSTDNTKEAIEEFQKKDKRIKYFYHKNAGPSSARNLGIKNSIGKYIAFLDSDDVWLPEKLEKQVAVISKSEESVGYVFSNGIITNTCGDEREEAVREFPKDVFNNNKETLRFFLALNGINACSNILVKKEIFAKCGLFDLNLPNFEDPELLIRVASKFSLEHMDDVLYIRKINKTSLHKTIDIKKSIEARKYILEKHKELYKKNRETKGEVVKKIVGNIADQGDIKRDFDLFVFFLLYSKVDRRYVKILAKYILIYFKII
jgi:glycosyltransferase involved in cell wall biosynthesis